MKLIHVIKLKINAYALFISVLFVSISFLMEYFSKHKSFENFIITMPLIIITCFWCKNSSYLIKKSDSQLNRNQIFKRDMFLIFYSFICSDLIYLLFQYNNIDRAEHGGPYLYIA